MEPCTETAQNEPHDFFCAAWQCRRRTDKRCPHCERAHYCSKPHLRDDWSWHKPLCLDKTVLDGQRVLGVLYKVLEDVSRALDGYRYDASTTQHNDTVLVKVQEKAQCDDRSWERAMYDGPSPPVQDGPEHTRYDEFRRTMGEVGLEEHRLAQRCYWALRCMADAYALNLALCQLLRVCQLAGYKRVRWTTTVEHPLEPVLRVVAVKPRLRVERQVGNTLHTDPLRKPVVHCVVALAGDFVVDASAGRFWQFTQQTKPVMYCRDFEYEALVGEISEYHGDAKARMLSQFEEKVGDRVDSLVFRSLCELQMDPGLLTELEDASGAKDVTAQEERDAQRRRTLKQMRDDYEARLAEKQKEQETETEQQ